MLGFDCFKIYSNEQIINTLTSMISSERLSHAFLLHGEKGLGKKKIARYICAQMLCRIGNGIPCGKCKDCLMIAHDAHPDVKWIFHNSDVKGFSVASLRELSIDALVSPNEGERKVYIFADCDLMSIPAQNTLLKLVEEPPSHTHFIFTATTKSAFLPTILSRVISLGVSEVSISDCEKALIDKGVTDKTKIACAVSAFGGNIGMCLDFINNDELQRAVEISKSITDCLCSNSEYALLKSLSQLDGNKQLTKTVLKLLIGIIRDGLAIRLDSDKLIGCYKNGSEALSKRLSARQATEIFNKLTLASQRIDGNANLSLTLTSICAGIKNIQ